jgi:hypothetical protein
VGSRQVEVAASRFLEDLPKAIQASHNEVTYLIEENKLYGKGIGYIDTHILASSMLSTIPLWTLDKRLDAILKNLTIPQ